MIVYGMVYKRGHKRKNWQMRLFVLDGSTCKYYELGNNPNTQNTQSRSEQIRAARDNRDLM